MGFGMKRPSSLACCCIDEFAKRARQVDHATVGEDWPLNTHRDFVEAVMKCGIKQASPAVIRQEMTLTSKAVTAERIKSKLQKYRGSKEKYVDLFMKEYDEWMKKATPLTNGTCGDMLCGKSDSEVMSILGMNCSLGGEEAAFLTQKVVSKERCHRNTESCSVASAKSNETKVTIQNGTQLSSDERIFHIHVPILSEAEKESELGKAIRHVLAIFDALTEQRALISCQAKKQETANPQNAVLHKDELSSMYEKNIFNCTKNKPKSVCNRTVRKESHLVYPQVSFGNDGTKQANEKEVASRSTCMLLDAEIMAALETIEPEPWEEADNDCRVLGREY